MNKINQPHPMVVPNNAPRKVIVANGVVCRWGFVSLGNGFSRCVEQRFVRMPEKDNLRKYVETYNAANGIDDPFNPTDYGFKTE